MTPLHPNSSLDQMAGGGKSKKTKQTMQTCARGDLLLAVRQPANSNPRKAAACHTLYGAVRFTLLTFAFHLYR